MSWPKKHTFSPFRHVIVVVKARNYTGSCIYVHLAVGDQILIYEYQSFAYPFIFNNWSYFMAIGKTKCTDHNFNLNWFFLNALSKSQQYFLCQAETQPLFCFNNLSIEDYSPLMSDGRHLLLMDHCYVFLHYLTWYSNMSLCLLAHFWAIS